MNRRAFLPPVVVLGLFAACGSSSRDALQGGGHDAGGISLGDGAGVFIDAASDAGRVCLPDGLDQEGCNCPTGDATRACYTGTPETRGKGVCRDGTQKCERKGEFFAWGACVGSMGPNKEACASQVDINCNGKVGCDDPQCASDPTCDTPCTEGDSRPCYEGKAGTEGVGACKDGIQSCVGGHWTKGCVGQVLPGTEPGHCADNVDNDCNGTKDCQDFACVFDLHCILGCTAGATRSCYDGPPGTDGVATCHGGTQTCKQDGSGFGPCSGEVLPAAEAGHCNDGIDNDCNGWVDCLDPACVTTPACCVNNPSPVDGTIWANSPSTLYRIDPNSYAITTVGQFNVGDQITDLALTPNGVLYAVSFTEIYSVDKTTGAATQIITLSGTGNDGMTFLPNGKLLAGDSSGDVKLIDPNLGTFSTIGNFGSSLQMAGDLVAVANGTMYGTSRTSAGGGDATDSNVLMQVNPQTGVATAIGPTGFTNVWGLAYANAHVIGFNTEGKIIRIDVATGAGTVVATKNVQFWGATQSPLVDANRCP